MRKLLTLLLVASFFSASAESIILVRNGATWSATDISLWNVNRLPRSGDRIIIPANFTLHVTQDLSSLSNFTLFLDVYGTIHFDGTAAKLALSPASNVTVYSGGRIYATTTNGNGNNIQAGTASQVLSIGGSALYRGNDGIISGPVFGPIAGGGWGPIPTPLPVKYLGFSAARKSGDVLVQWSTSQEINAAFYEVERSEDGAKWKTVGKVKAAGTTNNTTNYTFTDFNAAPQTVYYRIKQVDVDGKFEYTAIRTVKADATANNVNALAVRGNIVLQFSKQATTQVEVRLVSLNGHVVSRQVYNRPVGQLVIPASVKGNYILTVSDQQDIQLNKQILL